MDIVTDESSIAEPEAVTKKASFCLEFEIVKGSTKRRKNKLINSRGFSCNLPQELTAEPCPSLPKPVNLIFAGTKQLELLCGAKAWYVNGTFKLCREPFTEFLTVNAFIRSGECAKQVPLCFFLMSGKKKDYRAVFEALHNLLPVMPLVRGSTLDFERALWSALPPVYPTVKLQGCSFHWTQALWRKVIF